MEINPATFTGPQNQNQNLVELTKVSVSTPPGFWRALILDFLSVAAALFFGYSYFLYLTTGLSPWYTVAGLTSFAVLSALQVFLAQGIGRRVLIILAEAAAMVVAFAFYINLQVVLIAGGIVFVVLFWGYFAGRMEVGNEVEIHFFKATASAIGKVTTAAILFLLIVYAPQAQGQGIFIPRASFGTLFDWSSGALNSLYPGVTFNGSFGAFATSLAKQELANNPAFLQLSPAEQSAAVTQATAQLSNGILKTTGVAPTSDEPVSDVAYNYILAMLKNLQNQFQSQFLIVWVIALFLIFRTVGFIFVWVAQFISLIVYEILLAAGFMRIEGVPQTKETIRY
jgi:hypothetical protein